MAGHYFYDPRPFYGHDGSNGLLPLDELFYGRYEPVPYWMDQRMVPVPAFDDYYPGQKHAAMARGLPQLQQYAYKRPESRDDIGVDMYKRSPYNFNGMAMPMPGYGGQQQRQSYDDTWVHAMTPFGPAQQHGNMPRSGADQYRQMPGQMEVPMGYNMPSGNSNGNRGVEMPVNNGHMSNKGSTMGHNGSTMGHNGNTMGHSGNTMGHSGNTMGHSGNTMHSMHNMHNMNNPNNPNNMGNNGNNGNTGSRMTGSMGNSGSNHGSQGSKQMGGSGQQFGNKSSGGYGNGYGHGYENVKSSSAGGKSMNAKMHGSQSSQRYGDGDSSSDDSDDEYAKGHNNGMKWATKGSAKHGNGHPSFSQMKSGSKGGHGYDSVSSQHKKSGGHHGGSKSGQSMISKMLRFGGDSSSSDSEDEGYGHSKSKASKGSSKMGGLHGSHGSLQSYGHPQLQSKQTMISQPYGSSHSKGVELKVPICCDNCERKVRDCLKYMDGVENVLCDQWNRKVIVYGNVKADSVLKRVRKVKKGSELWQQGKQQQQQLRVY